MLVDGIEGGPELRHRRSGSQTGTRAKLRLAERRRSVGDRLEPSLTLRKTGRRNRLTFQLQEGHPLSLLLGAIIGLKGKNLQTQTYVWLFVQVMFLFFIGPCLLLIRSVFQDDTGDEGWWAILCQNLVGISTVFFAASFARSIDDGSTK
jgi:hypothetical protein